MHRSIFFSTPGISLALGSAALFALYSVLSKPLISQIGAMASTCLCFICGGLELLALIALSHIPGISSLLDGGPLEIFAHTHILGGIHVDNIVLVLFISVVLTGFGFIFFFTSMELVNPVFASCAFYIKPALAPLFAFLILGEGIGTLEFIGVICIVSASCLNVAHYLKPRAQHTTQDLPT